MSSFNLRKMWKKDWKKRSQAEILGLAIVFVIIGVGLLFYMKYSGSQSSAVKQSFVESNTASNMLNSLLKTTTKCKDATVNDLVQDCAYAKAINCMSFGTESDNPVPQTTSDSCTYLYDFIKSAFDKTFKEWGDMNYEFSIYSQNGALTSSFPLRSNADVCEGEKQTETSYVPTRAGTYTVELSICK